MCACCAGELQQQALTRLALQTLGSFDFGPARLLEFCRDHVVSYLDESDVVTRRAAALAAAQVRPAPAPAVVVHVRMSACRRPMKVNS